MILIVDDDVPAANGLERVLRYAGFDATAVNSGMDALSLLPVRKPKLLIIDEHMPCIDGITLIKSIRADPNFSDVPILMYTSDISSFCQHAALAAGAQDFLVKGTIGWETLVSRVRQLIEKADKPLRLAE